MFHGFSLNLHPGCPRPCCGTVAGQEESETSEAEPGVEQEPCKIARAELMLCDNMLSDAPTERMQPPFTLNS